MKRLFRFAAALACLCPVFTATPPALAQQPTDADKQATIATMRKEMEEAIQKVKAIANQPVPVVKQTPGMRVTTFTEGWFHEGAGKPSFLTVDVRATQELPYAKYGYVTSQLNPGYAFPGTQLEFNGAIKYFYIDRTIPKKRLTEAEMLEINRLYRIIGDRELKLGILERPPPPDRIEPEGEEYETEVLVVIPPPRENYVKAAIGVSIVLGLYIVYRMFRKSRG